MKVIVRNGDALKAFKILNRKLHKDNFFIELKEKERFKSKGEKKREAQKKGRARWKKDQKKKEALLLKLESQVRYNKRGNNDNRNANRNAGKPNTGSVGSTNRSGNFKGKNSNTNR